MHFSRSLGVDYLKPYTRKLYSPGYVDISVWNFGNEYSVPGTAVLGYGLEGGGYYPIYRCPKLKVPALAPHSGVVMRVYLKENTENWEQFQSIFWGAGESRFSLSVTYELPDVKEAAAAQGLSNKPKGMPLLYPEFVYDHEAVYRYSFLNDACNFNLEEDPDVDVTDWMNDDK
jgi:hypothetical protein